MNKIIRIVARKKSIEIREQIVAAYLKRLDRDESNFKRQIRPVFDEQEREVQANLHKLFEPAQRGIETKTVSDVIFNKDVQVTVLVEFDKRRLTTQMRDAIEEVFGRTGDEGSVFDFQNKRITNYLDKQSAKFAKKVNDTTIKQLRKELQAGIDANETIPQFRKRITDTFDDARGFRAERMARTELGSADNFGRVEAMAQSPVVTHKIWVSVLDNVTRDAHLDADGQRVKKSEDFDVGGEDLNFPRDPAGSAENIINCRCIVLEDFDR